MANWTVFWSETLTSFVTYFFTENEQFYFQPVILVMLYEGRSESKLKCVHKGVPKNKIKSDAENFF